MWKDDNNKPKIVITKNDVYDKLTKLDGDIWIIDNMLSSKFCENIIDKFEADNRKAKGATVDSSLEEGIKYIIITSFKPTIEESGIEYIKNQILKGY